MAEKGAAAELIAIKANMAWEIASVNDQNHQLTSEVTRLKERVSELHEEKARAAAPRAACRAPSPLAHKSVGTPCCSRSRA